jgi:hypothetical protein
MNDKCIHCGGDLQHTEGRRPKKFCSDTCRSSYWATEKRKRDPKYVRLDTYKNLEEKYETLKKVVEDLKGQVDFAHKPLIPNVPNEEAFVDPRLEAALKQPPKPLPQTLQPQPTVLSYQELLRLAPSMDTREKREEFLKEVTRNRKLSDAQKRAIHAKFPKPNP